VGADGLIKTAAIDEPRIEFNPDGSYKGLLVEPQRTNLVTYSEEFDDAVWSKTQSGNAFSPVVTANDAIAPDGTLTADKVVFNQNGLAASDESILSQVFTGVNGIQYVGSIFLKAASSSDVGKQIGIRFNFTDYTIITLTTEYQRVQFIGTAPSSSSFTYRLETRGTITQNEIVTVHIWGAQLEAGSTASSYIKTEASTVTRVADVVSKTGASALIGQTEGTVYAEVDLSNFGTVGQILRLTDGTSGTGRIAIERNPNNSQQIRVTFWGGATITYTYTLGVLKIAVRYGSDSRVYINGSLIGSPTTFNAVAPLSRISLGCSELNTAQLNDHIKAAAILPRAISQAEAISLTS